VKTYVLRRRSEEDWHYIKARNKVHAEMDIVRMIKLRRLVDNSLKFLTTKRERRLVKMQADRNVIQLRNFEKKILLKTFKTPEETNRLHGDSSGFDSGHHQEYFAEIRKQHEDNEITFTDREIKLIAGIQTK
jgi:hypothetical protein